MSFDRGMQIIPVEKWQAKNMWATRRTSATKVGSQDSAFAIHAMLVHERVSDYGGLAPYCKQGNVA
eukprot:5892391-Amphidinium_carterae.1